MPPRATVCIETCIPRPSIGTIAPLHALDSTDRTILRLLQKDGVLSTPQLAEQVAFSATPGWHRLKRLEDTRCITGYQANLDRPRLGLDIRVPTCCAACRG